MVPTLGASAVVMALQLCDHVSLAGFGYDMQHPDARLHYYESLRMGAMKSQVYEIRTLTDAHTLTYHFVQVTVVLCSCQAGGARRQRREALSEGPGGRGSRERPDGGAVMSERKGSKRHSVRCTPDSQPDLQATAQAAV